VAADQMQTNLENLQFMMQMLRRDMAVFELVQERFRHQEDEDNAEFERIMKQAVFDNKRAVELESLWFEHRQVQEHNLGMAQNSRARMQSASNNSHEMRFRRR